MMVMMMVMMVMMVVMMMMVVMVMMMMVMVVVTVVVAMLLPSIGQAAQQDPQDLGGNARQQQVKGTRTWDAPGLLGTSEGMTRHSV